MPLSPLRRTPRTGPASSETGLRHVLQPITRQEVLLAALLCALAAALFLGGALFTGKYLSPADMLFSNYPWSSQQPAGWSEASNGLLGDDVTQFEPWLQYSAQRLRAGEIPLWNPDNMLGAPFVGNMQSAVFYPPNWVYFLFPGPLSLDLRAWLKLFIAALGMYLLARKVAGVGPMGASVASIGFAFGAFMTVWLLHPQTGVAAWLPWLWLATAALLERPTPVRVSSVAVIVALVALAGHPETAYQLSILTGLFALFWLWRLRSPGWAYVARSFGVWVGACLLGACLSAVQILPFLEYLGNSASSILRGNVSIQSFSLPLYYAWTLVSPDLYGNPSHQDWWGPQANYNESSMYCGVLVVLLVLLVPLARGRAARQLSIFLLVLVAAAGAVAFNAPVVRQALVTVTFSGTMATQRVTLLSEFGLALLAGIGAQGFQVRLREARGRGKTLALYLGGASLLLLILGVGIPWLVGPGFFPAPGTPADAAVWLSGLAHAITLILLSSGLLAALAVVAPVVARLSQAHAKETSPAREPAVSGAEVTKDTPVAPVGRDAPLRRAGTMGRVGEALVWALPLLLFLDLFQAHADYVPEIPSAQHYPPTQATTFLQQQQAQQYQQGQQAPFRSIATVWTLLPNTNLMYGLSDLRGYDALEPLLYYKLMQAVDPTIRRNAIGGFRPVHSLKSHILDALDARYVVSEPGANPNYVQDLSQDSGQAALLTPPLEGGQTAGQTFVSRQDNLAQIEVFGAVTGAPPAGSLIFHLKSAPSDSVDLVTRTLDIASLPNNAWWEIPFPHITQARGKRFYFYFEASPAASDKGSSGGGGTSAGRNGSETENTRVQLEYTPGNPYGGGERMQAGKPASGDLLFGTYSFTDAANPRFNVVSQGGAGDASIFEDVRSLPRAWLVHRVEVQTVENNRLGRLADSTFDLAGAAMLSAHLPTQYVLPTDTSGSRGDTVKIATYKPETVQVATTSQIAGLLMLGDEQFPGWEASVDGQPAPILTADEALRAVYVPAGSHTVTFIYRPVSFRAGAAASLISLLLVLALVGWELVLRPRGLERAPFHFGHKLVTPAKASR